MLYKDRQIPELYDLKHFHDNDNDFINYEEVILDKSLSPRIYQNDMMVGYLDRIKKIVALMFDQINIIKNYKNYIVDKDYFKHKN
jgi:hypothetical protein